MQEATTARAPRLLFRDAIPPCLLLLVACQAGPPPGGSTWPETAPPPYPTPPSSESASSAPVRRQATVDVSAQSGSPLAKEYAQKGAQETLSGKATYYADSLAGNRTASGDVYRPNMYTAAHKKLPFGTIVRVTRIDTKKSTYVRINDRGPFGPKDRILDLSRAAAEELEMIRAGVVPVVVEVLQRP